MDERKMVYLLIRIYAIISMLAMVLIYQFR